MLLIELGVVQILIHRKPQLPSCFWSKETPALYMYILF